VQRGEKDAKRSSVVRRSGSGVCPSCDESCFWVQTTWSESVSDAARAAGERDECTLGYWWCAEGHSAFVRERGPSGRTGEWIRRLVQATEVAGSSQWHSEDDERRRDG